MMEASLANIYLLLAIGVILVLLLLLAVRQQLRILREMSELQKQHSRSQHDALHRSGEQITKMAEAISSILDIQHVSVHRLHKIAIHFSRDLRTHEDVKDEIRYRDRVAHNLDADSEVAEESEEEQAKQQPDPPGWNPIDVTSSLVAKKRK